MMNAIIEIRNMKLTRKTLIQLNNTLDYLRSQQSKAWYVVGKIKRAIKAELVETQESLKDVQDEHALKNADGKPIITRKGEREEITPLDLKAFEKAIAEMYAEEVEITLPQIPLSQVVDEPHPDAVMDVLFELSLIDEES